MSGDFECTKVEAKAEVTTTTTTTKPNANQEIVGKVHDVISANGRFLSEASLSLSLSTRVALLYSVFFSSFRLFLFFARLFVADSIQPPNDTSEKVRSIAAGNAC